jgi:hypothetical protein
MAKTEHHIADIQTTQSCDRARIAYIERPRAGAELAQSRQKLARHDHDAMHWWRARADYH